MPEEPLDQERISRIPGSKMMIVDASRDHLANHLEAEAAAYERSMARCIEAAFGYEDVGPTKVRTLRAVAAWIRGGGGTTLSPKGLSDCIREEEEKHRG